MAPRHARADLVALTVFYHDAVYEPRANGNEAASAALATAELAALSLPPAACARVAALVQLTDHREEPADDDARLLIDIDLAILAAPPARYAAYAADVRREYAHVPDPHFRSGRSAVLRAFLARPRIYRSPAFAPREAPARANLDDEIRRLAADG